MALKAGIRAVVAWVRLQLIRLRPALATAGIDPVALRTARTLPGDRLVESPVFVLSSVRSGSTLLRVMLNTHSAIHAPHELHLRNLKVSARGRYAQVAMNEIGLDDRSLQYLLWDRVLHRELIRHDKQVLVNKTPSDALIWRRIVECWPDARFIFLLRHPAAVTDSWQRARRHWTRDEAAADVLRYMQAVEQARVERGGLTVRYEDLTSDPAREMRRICDFLGLEWEPAMLDYAKASHGSLRAGLGDWSTRLKSGVIQPPASNPTPDRIPSMLSEISTLWGYTPPADDR
jgi:sulfotransferase family protein